MENWHNTDELDDLLGSDLDLDQAWSEFKKDKKKTRRFPIWWCFGFGSIFLLGMGWFFQNNISVEKEIEKPVGLELPSVTAIPSVEKVDLALIVEKDISQEEILPITNTSTRKRSIVSKQKASTIRENESIVASPKFGQLAYSMTNNQKVNSSQGIQEASSKKTLKNVNSSYPVAILQTIKSEANSQKIFISKELLNDKLVPLPLFPLTIPTQGVVQISIPNTPPTTSFSKKWGIGMTYLLANGTRSISDGEEAYTQRRQAEEQFLENNRIAFSVTKELSTSFFLQSGLILSQYRSKIEEDIQTLISPVEFEDVVIETHTQNDLTQEIIGTAQGSQLTINRFTRFQQYQTLSIPLQVGVQLPLSSYWQFRASTGVALSVYGQAKGHTFSSILPDGIYAPLSQLDYRKAGLIEGMGQLSLERSFGNTSLSLGVNGSIDLNNRLKQATSGMDKFSSYGIQMGVHRIF